MNVSEAGSQGVRSSLSIDGEGFEEFGVDEKSWTRVLERITREVEIMDMGAQIHAGSIEPVARRQSLQ